MKMKNVIRHSTNVITPIVIGFGVVAMTLDTISQVSAGTTSELPMHILGGLAFIGFAVFIRHATLLHVDSMD